eukprot:7644868-Pyramimonas_sp.AAC.2
MTSCTVHILVPVPSASGTAFQRLCELPRFSPPAHAVPQRFRTAAKLPFLACQSDSETCCRQGRRAARQD